MLTATRALALTLTLFVTACGPDINITITSGATGDPGSTGTDPATTGLGASETGPGEPGESSGDTCPSSSGEDSSTSTGSTGGSTSGGEPPPVCAVFTDDLGWHCECDGVEGDITADCGCVLEGDACVCGAEAYPAEACPRVPVCYDPTTAACSCPIVVPAPGVCLCGDVEVPCPPAEVCEAAPATGTCYCDGAIAPPDKCM